MVHHAKDLPSLCPALDALTLRGLRPSLAGSSTLEAESCSHYLEGTKAAKISKKAGTPHAWSNGLIVDEKGVNWYSIVDFWGSFYRVRLDANGDGFVENPDINEVAEGRTKLKLRVIVWSPGKDGKEETWTDNPKSWN